MDLVHAIAKPHNKIVMLGPPMPIVNPTDALAPTKFANGPSLVPLEDVVAPPKIALLGQKT